MTTHMLKERTSEEIRTRCGTTIATKRCQPGDVTIWERRVTCAGCQMKPQGRYR